MAKNLPAFRCLILMGALLYLISGISLAAPSFAEQFLSKEELAFIKAHPVIVVGGELDWPPFDFVNEKGEYAGICSDYLKLIAKKTGLEFRVETDGWQQLLKKMDAGEIDLLPAIYLNPERAAKYHFTPSYHQVQEYVFARDGETVKKPEDLYGRTVAIVSGFASIPILKENYPEIKILEAPSVDAAIDAVVTYKADFLLDSLAAMNYSLQQKTITHIRPVFPLKSHQLQRLHMASRKGMPLLASIISKVIDHLGESEKRQLMMPWLGYKRLEQKTEDARNALSLTEEETAYLERHPVLRWGYDVDWSPIEYFDRQDKKVKGIAADYIRLIGKSLGIKIKAVAPDRWSVMLQKIRQNEVDVLSAVARTSDREQYMLFTKAHISFPMVVISKKERPYISRLAMLSGLTIAVVNNYMSHDIIKEQHPAFNVLPVENLHLGLLAVERGDADVFVGNLATASHMISKSGLTNLKVIGQTEHDYNLSLGVPKNNIVLRDILQKALDQIDEEEANAIYQKWLRVTYKHKLDLTVLVAILLVAGFILGMILHWNRRLLTLNRTINNYLQIIDTHVITANADARGAISNVSDAFCQATGYSRSELVGESYRLFRITGTPAKFYKEIWLRLSASGIWKGEIKIKPKEGGHLWLDTMIMAELKQKTCTGYTIICHDISDKKSLELRAITDELTGLYNRRHFNSLFKDERNRARRENKVFAFFMMDIDNFKKYNDNYGHQKGDDALITVAKVLKNTLKRSSDKAFRLGGEEFGCLVAVNDMSEVQLIAEKIRKGIESAGIEHLQNQPYGVVTTSLGIYALLPEDDRDHLEFVYHMADKLLYKAKHKGRNRMEI